ncbi:MAG: tRNA (adenosine(37)-N6)-dimethylallyltransferase MiaA [Oscillospiraceae bacterium]|nr:tRNA (adenosine(37)-N6)-dimethylallyltransferase MiaA [Oscillospiraceae bacterium]
MTTPDIIIITGPTATGKTMIGALLAHEIGGEVVSADSMQIYKYMDIGTAKPTVDERLGIPHHMIDIVAPGDDYSAARYIEDAARCIDDIIMRGKMPILVGGSGLYIDSLVSGRDFALRGDSELRSALEAEYDNLGGDVMLSKLREFDADSASILTPNDKKRLVRAFEVYITTGMPISQHNINTQLLPPRYATTKFILDFSDRAMLYARINRRVDSMVEKGLADEVRALLDMGVPLECTAMQAIGYKEMLDVVVRGSDLAAAIEKIKMESRRYAKRQLTWLRRDSDAIRVIWEDDVLQELPPIMLERLSNL